MTNSEIFIKAHQIAKKTVAIVGDYRMAFSFALKSVYQDLKNGVSTLTKLDQAKKCAKDHGVKGFRKLRLKKELYIVGKQTAFLNTHTAKRLINRFEEIGYRVSMKKTLLELAEKGFLDCITLEAA